MTPLPHDPVFTDIDLVQALMDSGTPGLPEPISEDWLVRYAFGWSTDDEEEKVLDALILSQPLRQDLIQIRQSLDQPEARSNGVKQFLDFAITTAAGALGALERGLADWKSSFEGNLVVQHSQRDRDDRIASLAAGIAWARSGSKTGETVSDENTVVVEVEAGLSPKLPLAAAPAAANGELTLGVDFAPHFLSEYSDQTLELSFKAGPLTIPLRAWRVAELPRDGRLSAKIPSSLTGPIPRAAIGLALSA